MVVDRLAAKGYVAMWWLLDSSSCGMPQARVRWWLVAWRKDCLKVSEGYLRDSMIALMQASRWVCGIWHVLVNTLPLLSVARRRVRPLILGSFSTRAHEL
eukprot:2099327-Prorocentrum_lima.AAC.1